MPKSKDAKHRDTGGRVEVGPPIIARKECSRYSSVDIQESSRRGITRKKEQAIRSEGGTGPSFVCLGGLPTGGEA